MDPNRQQDDREVVMISIGNYVKCILAIWDVMNLWRSAFCRVYVTLFSISTLF